MLPADPTSTADTSHVILPVAASTYTSPPHGDPDPGTPAPKWPGPRTLGPGPDPGPRGVFGRLGRSRRRLAAVRAVPSCFFTFDST